MESFRIRYHNYRKRAICSFFASDSYQSNLRIINIPISLYCKTNRQPSNCLKLESLKFIAIERKNKLLSIKENSGLTDKKYCSNQSMATQTNLRSIKNKRHLYESIKTIRLAQLNTHQNSILPQNQCKFLNAVALSISSMILVLKKVTRNNFIVSFLLTHPHHLS